jgi:DNA-damage-inducible protein J
MPSKTSTIRARVDPELKADAEAIMEELGLTASDVIRTLYRQIVLRKGLPFELKVPNAETLEAFRDGEEGRVTRYEDFDDFAKMLLED